MPIRLRQRNRSELEYRHIIKHGRFKDVWTKSGANEFGKLFQGIGKIDGTQRVKGMDMCHWIHKQQIPANKKTTYACICCDIRPEKNEEERTRITADGNQLEYEEIGSTKTVGLETAKILFNGIISTPGAKCTTMDIIYMYLNMSLKDFQYMRFHIDIIPDEVINEYNLRDKVDNGGWLYTVKFESPFMGLKKVANLPMYNYRRY